MQETAISAWLALGSRLACGLAAGCKTTFLPGGVSRAKAAFCHWVMRMTCFRLTLLSPKPKPLLGFDRREDENGLWRRRDMSLSVQPTADEREKRAKVKLYQWLSLDMQTFRRTATSAILALANSYFMRCLREQLNLMQASSLAWLLKCDS
jgi:hypothetical protein